MPDPRPGSIERIIDANANRAREGLRVAEDYARFVLGDAALSSAIRDERHAVTRCVAAAFPGRAALAERDTARDPGADPDGSPPCARAGVGDIVTGAFKRAEEALRVLAEFVRALDPAAAAGCERARYRVYDLERDTLAVAAPLATLRDARLAVVVESPSSGPECERVAELCAIGVKVFVAAPGAETDTAFVEAALAAARVVEAAGALLLVADRCDLARLCGAHGVMLGPRALRPDAARRLLSRDALVGSLARSADDARDLASRGASLVVCDGTVARSVSPRASGMPPVFVSGCASATDADAALAAGAERLLMEARTCLGTSLEDVLNRLGASPCTGQGFTPRS
jgi:thiamine-phosphate pyrophosphorylase